MNQKEAIMHADLIHQDVGPDRHNVRHEKKQANDKVWREALSHKNKSKDIAFRDSLIQDMTTVVGLERIIARKDVAIVLLDLLNTAGELSLTSIISNLGDKSAIVVFSDRPFELKNDNPGLFDFITNIAEADEALGTPEQLSSDSNSERTFMALVIPSICKQCSLKDSGYYSKFLQSYAAHKTSLIIPLALSDPYDAVSKQSVIMTYSSDDEDRLYPLFPSHVRQIGTWIS